MRNTDVEQTRVLDREWILASRFMLAWVLSCVAYVGVVTALSPAHKRTVFNVAGPLVFQAALLTWFASLSRAVRRGKRHSAALWVMCVYTALGTMAVLMAVFAFSDGDVSRVMPHVVAWCIVVVLAVLGVHTILRAVRLAGRASRGQER